MGDSCNNNGSSSINSGSKWKSDGFGYVGLAVNGKIIVAVLMIIILFVTPQLCFSQYACQL